jgi:hypothetical protein
MAGIDKIYLGLCAPEATVARLAFEPMQRTTRTWPCSQGVLAPMKDAKLIAE